MSEQLTNLWFSFTLIRAATYSASVDRFAFTGESGRNTHTRAPTIIVNALIAWKKILQLAKSVLAKLTPYVRKLPKIVVREFQT